MEISVIIVAYNSSAFIEKCLLSIFEMLKGVDHEIIVVDNASRDKTGEIIQERFAKVLFIQNPMNLGFSKANNLALRRTKGDFVLFINPDTVWNGGDIQEAMQFLREHPKVMVLGARLVLNDGSWQKSCGNFPTLGRELKEALFLPRLFPRSEWSRGVFIHQERGERRAVDWISGTFFLCKRDVIINIGGFDERFFMYYEDIDLSKRVRETGKEIYYYPEIEIIHYQKFPSIYDFGESPYIYFHIHFGLTFAIILRYIMIFRTLLRIGMFSSLVLLTGKALFKEKLLTNYRTFKFHLFEAPKVIRRLKNGISKQTY